MTAPRRRRPRNNPTGTPPPRVAAVQERLRGRLPGWALLVVGALFIGPTAAHAPVFGDPSGALAAGTGVFIGLLIAAAATRWKWDALSVLAAVLAAYLLLGGAVALPKTTLYHVLPTAQTLQVLVLGAVQSWKDLLTVTPPASSYIGPALVPWICGLVSSTLAGLATVRRGSAILGSIPIILMGAIGIAFGPSGTRPMIWPVIVWWAAVLLWWAAAAQRRRIADGEDILIGRRTTATNVTATATTGRSRSVINIGRRAVSALVMTAIGAGLAVPATIEWGPWNSRIVGRDVVEPPLDVRAYPSPLAAYRHYTTDLERKKLLSVTGLPESARVRIAVMDVYDGTTFGMSEAETHPGSGYLSVGSRLPEQVVSEDARLAEMTMKTSGLIGPWVPSVGTVQTLTFSGEDADEQQDGLHADLWSDSALTTGPTSAMDYTVISYVEPKPSDGRLADVEATDFYGRDENVPEGIAELAASVSAKEQSPLAKARAIERYLSEDGFYSNEDAAASRPGHRADRLQRMLDAEQLIGDDEQYAALMALMLHSIGMNARVVMGFYSEDLSGDASFYGADMHVWVEVEFEDAGWGVFDPTPPRDQKPRTDVPEPNSVPRPQVLQPPEPPEEPVDLPPTTSDRDAESQDDEDREIPWGVIVGVSVSILVIIGPVLAILLAKALRRRARRNTADPRAALVGSWDEVVDMATDAGITVMPNKTRQETAWELTSLWPDRADSSRGDARRGEGDSGEAAVIPGWTLFAQRVPTIVAVARRADIADFAEEGGSQSEAVLAWNEVDGLRRELRSTARPLTRIHRALSLRSLLARYRRARASHRNRKHLAENAARASRRTSQASASRRLSRKKSR